MGFDDLYTGEVSDRTFGAAKAVSFIAQPTFLSIPVFALICSGAGYWSQLLVAVIFATVAPTLTIVGWAKRVGSDDAVDVPRREDRAIPLVIGTAFYLAGTVALYLIHAPTIATVLMLCYAVNTLAILAVSFYWKISIHACGVIGPTMALCLVYGPVGLLYGLILVPVAWSRYVMRKHTPAQIVAGALQGFVLTSVLFFLLL